MTKDKQRKDAIRAEMKRTGRSYTQAAREIEGYVFRGITCH
ncbi:hypothetical protein [Streptomyces sp. NBC_01445]|nr:hypothetical protein [Streptomyces sp. NBC_01445]WSE01988.1 hypothetical protein OG574_00210 [Streptomyces sp. NBC_01445]WSE10342.1 hypothetical protein OG574_47800 [Streptomyces sp. NBC_01445]WSE11091.1 hypothetical protein OG574_48220 [Streptomyces sp. NBC_01445]